MSRYVLYGGGVSRSAAVEAVLRELDLPYRLEPVDIMKGEHREESFLAKNPLGLVPVLETPEGDILHETSGLMLYLADRHPERGLSPLPTSPARGRFLSRLFFLVNEIEGPSKAVFFAHRWAPRPEDAAGVRARVIEMLLKRWEVYDEWLEADGPWAMGEAFTIADILMTMWAGYGLEAEDDIVSRFPAVRRCFDAVMERPAASVPIRAVYETLRAVRAQSARGG